MFYTLEKRRLLCQPKNLARMIWQGAAKVQERLEAMLNRTKAEELWGDQEVVLVAVVGGDAEKQGKARDQVSQDCARHKLARLAPARERARLTYLRK